MTKAPHKRQHQSVTPKCHGNPHFSSSQLKHNALTHRVSIEPLAFPAFHQSMHIYMKERLFILCYTSKTMHLEFQLNPLDQNTRNTAEVVSRIVQISDSISFWAIPFLYVTCCYAINSSKGCSFSPLHHKKPH